VRGRASSFRLTTGLLAVSSDARVPVGPTVTAFAEGSTTSRIGAIFCISVPTWAESPMERRGLSVSLIQTHPQDPDRMRGSRVRGTRGRGVRRDASGLRPGSQKAGPLSIRPLPAPRVGGGSEPKVSARLVATLNRNSGPGAASPVITAAAWPSDPLRRATEVVSRSADRIRHLRDWRGHNSGSISRSKGDTRVGRRVVKDCSGGRPSGDSSASR
jgi:hypothetical protein